MLISNNNYAANSDYIFAETVDHRRFGELNDKSIFISEKNAASVTYKSTMLHISDGDTIFCRTVHRSYIKPYYKNVVIQL